MKLKIGNICMINGSVNALYLGNSTIDNSMIFMDSDTDTILKITEDNTVENVGPDGSEIEVVMNITGRFDEVFRHLNDIRQILNQRGHVAIMTVDGTYKDSIVNVEIISSTDNKSTSISDIIVKSLDGSIIRHIKDCSAERKISYRQTVHELKLIGA
jgi:hypothetical protein